MVSKKSNSPKLNKSNANRMTALSMAGKLNRNTLSVIAKELKKSAPARHYLSGSKYFYKHYTQIMKSLDRYIWNQVAGPRGFITARNLPNDSSLGWHDEGFREAVVWKRIRKMFPKFPVSSAVIDSALTNTPLPLNASTTYEQWLLITHILNTGQHRQNLNNKYDKMEGFVDSLLDELQAEIETR